MYSEICIIRHGITTGNEQKLYYGSTDVPLADKGVEELRELTKKKIYPDSDTAEYYTSGMLRTEQSFHIIYNGKEHDVIPELKELDFGDFEMKNYKELEDVPEYKEWLNAKAEGTPPPNGESVDHFKDRVLKGYEKLRNYNAAKCFALRNKGVTPLTICICHGGSISVILDSIWPGKYENFYQWIPDPGHGYLLKMEDLKVVGFERF